MAIEWGLVMLILGVVALIESLIILLFPDKSINLGRKWLKSPKIFKKIGLIELIIAIILLLIGMNI